MQSLPIDRIQDLLILHRGLDPNDEDSTVEEQAQKLLFLRAVDKLANEDKNVQLITCLEALMELSKTFSSEVLDSVVMQNKLWGFYECEPGIWLVVSIVTDHKATIDSNPPEFASPVTSSNLQWFLRNLYSLFFTVKGPIQKLLNGGVENECWKCIQETILARKKLRKVQRNLDNSTIDFQSLLEDRDNGIEREDLAGLISLTESQISELKEKKESISKDLESLLSSNYNVLPKVKSDISSFMTWYLSLDDLNDFSLFPSLRDVSFEPRSTALSTHAIYRLVQAIKESVSEIPIKCLVTFDNRLMWTDFDKFFTKNMLEFLLRYDSSFMVDGYSAANKHLRFALDDFVKSICTESRCEYSSLSGEAKYKLAQWLVDRDEGLKDRAGLASIVNICAGLEKQTIRIPSQLHESKKATKISFLDTVEVQEGAYALYFNAFSSSPQVQCLPVGRCFVLYTGKLAIVVATPEEHLSSFRQREITSLIPPPGSPDLWRLSRLVEKIDDLKKLGGGMRPPAPGSWVAEEVSRIQLLYISSKVNKAVKASQAENEKYNEMVGKVVLPISVSSVSSSRFVAPPTPPPNAFSSSSKKHPRMNTGNILSMLQSRPLVDRDAKVLCCSPAFSALKLFSPDIDGVLSSFINLDISSGNANAILDRYFLDLPCYGLNSARVLQIAAESFGIPTLRALQDVWKELLESESTASIDKMSKSKSPYVNAIGDDFKARGESSNVNFICSRVSTFQRGGTWVTGKRLFSGQVLIAILMQCATFDDVVEVMQEIVNEAQTTL